MCPVFAYRTNDWTVGQFCESGSAWRTDCGIIFARHAPFAKLHRGSNANQWYVLPSHIPIRVHLELARPASFVCAAAANLFACGRIVYELFYLVFDRTFL